jgi:hypothetical protein
MAMSGLSAISVIVSRLNHRRSVRLSLIQDANDLGTKSSIWRDREVSPDPTELFLSVLRSTFQFRHLLVRLASTSRWHRDQVPRLAHSFARLAR